MGPKLVLHQEAVADERTIIELLNTILNRQEKVVDLHAALQERLDSHVSEEGEAIRQMLRALPLQADGSPDVDGHREYHASLIEEAKARAELWRELRKELVRKGLWGLMGALAFLFMYWWNREVKV